MIENLRRSPAVSLVSLANGEGSVPRSICFGANQLFELGGFVPFKVYMLKLCVVKGYAPKFGGTEKAL